MEFACSLESIHMIRNLLLFLFISITMNAAAMQSDTSAYQIQRLKINGLLAERSARFGQYDQSLEMRTGFFGFQTKSDIKNSNEILRQIVLNDNNIFKELKILMDYKEQEVKEVINTANTTNTRIQGYMLAIKKLQDQNQLLKKEALTVKKDKQFTNYVIIILIIALLATFFYILKKRKKELSNEKITV